MHIYFTKQTPHCSHLREPHIQGTLIWVKAVWRRSTWAMPISKTAWGKSTWEKPITGDTHTSEIKMRGNHTRESLHETPRMFMLLYWAKRHFLRSPWQSSSSSEDFFSHCTWRDWDSLDLLHSKQAMWQLSYRLGPVFSYKLRYNVGYLDQSEAYDIS